MALLEDVECTLASTSSIIRSSKVSEFGRYSQATIADTASIRELGDARVAHSELAEAPTIAIN